MALLDATDIARSLGAGVELDAGLAEWVVDVVSATALDIAAGATWNEPSDVPAAVTAVLGLAARRLYTNPDRLTREAEGDVNYTLDVSVTGADIFTPAEEARIAKYAVTRITRPIGFGTVSTYRGDAREPGNWGW